MNEKLLFNQTNTARLIGISVNAFRAWNLQPARMDGRTKLYYWPDVFQERDFRYFPEEEQVDDDGTRLDLDQQRARQAKEQADKLALENAASCGELVFISDMDEVLARALTAFRERLAAAALKLGPQVNPGNPNLARNLIEADHNDCLAELADFDPSGAG